MVAASLEKPSQVEAVGSCAPPAAVRCSDRHLLNGFFKAKGTKSACAKVFQSIHSTSCARFSVCRRGRLLNQCDSKLVGHDPKVDRGYVDTFPFLKGILKYIYL